MNSRRLRSKMQNATMSDSGSTLTRTTRVSLMKCYQQSLQRTKTCILVAEKLITELKAELAAQKGLASRLELSENHRENLQAKVKDLDNSLSSARSEIKALTAKLAAARSTEAGVKVPGSALKANVAGKQASSIEVVQAAQAKEDLYGDLTGLIIRGMKHDEQEDVFDCIQTGKNGSKCSDRSPTEPLTINHHASPPFQACVRRGRCLRQLRRCAIHVQATTGSQSR